MEPFGVKATLLATAMSSLLSLRALRRKSLTPGGSIAAFCVAFLLVGTGLRGLNLLTFYFVSIKATKYKKEIKAKIDGTIASHNGSTIRGTSQVLACSLLATVLSVVHAIWCGAERLVVFGDGTSTSTSTSTDWLAASLTCGILAHHATCLADTLASEMGILSRIPPRLITQPWKTVPSGTNGGVTPNGFFWSALGGAIIGISTVVLDGASGILQVGDGDSNNDGDSMASAMAYACRMVGFTTACGLSGSVIDSLLGATLQQSYYDPDTKMVYQEEDHRPETTLLVVDSSKNVLTNELVNLVSVTLATVLGATVLGPLFFY
eukprot:CAMPEP_0172363960 /NCGR_PEP_ID=MMETSP1060-20121228/7196_1 /TAXON_ID=37318 /ORGANISM="Pseudo-nitzschia pungens, Strain cf. cingulata" /LENGTH=320 /DNA_ID=CAMNT_0013086847 /DNA_START=63 /DNA_END=1025 /DNA_ORIENTATION=+